MSHGTSKLPYQTGYCSRMVWVFLDTSYVYTDMGLPIYNILFSTVLHLPPTHSQYPCTCIHVAISEFYLTCQSDISKLHATFSRDICTAFAHVELMNLDTQPGTILYGTQTIQNTTLSLVVTPTSKDFSRWSDSP